MDPNEAATKAIQIVRAAATTSGSAEQHAEPPQVSTASSHEDQRALDQNNLPLEAKLNELAQMGFFDTERNSALLQKYGGRVERVVEALLGGG